MCPCSYSRTPRPDLPFCKVSQRRSVSRDCAVLIKHRTPPLRDRQSEGRAEPCLRFWWLLQCGYWCCFFQESDLLSSDGHVRFELVSSRGVRLAVSHPTHTYTHTHTHPHSPTPHFTPPKPSRYLTRSGQSDGPRRSEPVLSTSGFVHLPGTAEVTRSVSRHDPPPSTTTTTTTSNPSMCISVYLSQKKKRE